MLTDLARPAGRPLHDASESRSAERVIPLGRDTDAPADAPPSLSRVPEAHRLDAAVIDTVIEQLPVGVLVADRSGLVVYANEVARGLRLDHLAPVRRALTCALRTGDAVREDTLELRQSTGSRGWFALTATPIRGAGGAVTSAVLTLADVTAARRLSDWEPVMESLINL
jgi:PAS domain-containing protein